jgi:hypothetical protein
MKSLYGYYLDNKKMRIKGINSGEIVYISFGIVLLFYFRLNPWVLILYFLPFLFNTFHFSKMTYNFKGERIEPQQEDNSFNANNHF